MSLLNGIHKEVYSAHPLLGVEECFSVDECGFMISREAYVKFPFANLGRTWHLYAVELCLRIKKNGGKVGVMPVEAWHCSLGKLDGNYYKTFIRICKQYKRQFKGIYTTCVSISFSDYFWYFKLMKRWFHLKIKEKRNKLNGAIHESIGNGS